MQLNKVKRMSSLRWENCEDVLGIAAESTGWALCVGAGISRGAFPDWAALVQSLIAQDSKVANAGELLTDLNKSFSLDALIQAAKKVLGYDDAQFGLMLRDRLYERLKGDAGNRWKVVVKALTAASPAQMTRGEWRAFRIFIKQKYPRLSALRLAESIVKVARTPKEPSAIISFNAEPLLYALIHALHVKAHSREEAELKELRLLDRVTRGISSRQRGRIPYVFCHGLMPLDGGLKLFAELASPEKLVFSEGEYLQLANSSFSWQSSLFLGTAVLRSMVFVGLSFSDPNLRRWLAWIQANRAQEIRLRNKDIKESRHYWICSDPQDSVKRTWTEASVSHLGVQIVWIDSWDNVGKYLNRMLGT
jgi:hypothetical protein